VRCAVECAFCRRTRQGRKTRGRRGVAWARVLNTVDGSGMGLCSSGEGGASLLLSTV
jgi:hypothetical protein